MRPGSSRPEPWSEETLRARIADARKGARHAAASPDEVEIAAYAEGLGRDAGAGLALVLGMTPELRRLALRRFRRVVSVEISPRAIALYRGWVPAEDAPREGVVRADWLGVDGFLARPSDAVLGDGIFGNLADVAGHRRLLEVVARLLARGAPLVVRQAVIPRGFDPEAESLPVLLARHRRGELDPDEFGFAVRLIGHHRTCYDADAFVLDNARLFRGCEEAFASGLLSEDEWRAIRRYRFEGRNCILPQHLWESLLDDAGFSFETVPCHGRDWYRYYPVYACRVESRRERRPPTTRRPTGSR